MNQITSLKDYKLLLEKKKDPSSDLIIVDVQPSFIKFFNQKYLQELKKYCYQFGRVFNISDNKTSDEIYTFPGQISLYEKRYGGELSFEDIDYYFTTENAIEVKKDWDKLYKGWYKETTNGDLWLFVDSQHIWQYVDKELVDFVKELAKTTRKVTIVGGAGDINGDHLNSGECLTDIITLFDAFNINYKIDDLYVYTAKGCRFKEKEESIKESIKIQGSSDGDKNIDNFVQIFEDYATYVEIEGYKSKSINVYFNKKAFDTNLEKEVNKYKYYPSTINGYNFKNNNDTFNLKDTIVFKPIFGTIDTKIPNYIYHVSPSNNDQNILHNGLIPKEGNKKDPHPARIYFLKNQGLIPSLVKQFKIYNPGDYSVFKIDTTNLDTVFYMDEEVPSNLGIYVQNYKIDPKFITKIDNI